MGSSVPPRFADSRFAVILAAVLAAPGSRRWSRVHRVSLRCDPARKTPSLLRPYGGGAPPNGVEWAFLTPERTRTLVPLLDGFGQDVRVEIDAQGRPAGPLAHVLKVFLLDEHAVVREIYTTAYLFPEVIMNDIKTIQLEDRPQRKVVR